MMMKTMLVAAALCVAALTAPACYAYGWDGDAVVLEGGGYGYGADRRRVVSVTNITDTWLRVQVDGAEVPGALMPGETVHVLSGGGLRYRVNTCGYDLVDGSYAGRSWHSQQTSPNGFTVQVRGLVSAACPF